jgi:hypothetical protein
MVKKLKIKELHEEPERSGQDIGDLTMISLDDLASDTTLEVPDLEAPAVHPGTDAMAPSRSRPVSSKESQEKKPEPSGSVAKKKHVETRVEIINDQVSFERNQLNLHIFKGLSVAFILFALDLILHFLQILDGVEVLKLENFDSFYFNDDQLLNLAKIVAFFLVVHWMTPKSKLTINRRGIFCQHVTIMNLFYSSSQVFLSWDEIKSVKYNVRLFEHYLFFYGDDNVELGQIDFTIDQKKEFFKFIEKNAGKNHPVTIVQKDIKLV